MQQTLRDTDQHTDQHQGTTPAGAMGVRGWLTRREKPARKGTHAAYGMLCGLALWIIGPEHTFPAPIPSSDWLIP